MVQRTVPHVPAVGSASVPPAADVFEPMIVSTERGKIVGRTGTTVLEVVGVIEVDASGGGAAAGGGARPVPGPYV